MLVYLTRRLFWLVITLLVITAITFVIYFVLPPVSPAVLFAGKEATPQLVATVQHELGLDHPVWVQYLLFLKHLVLGDQFGWPGLGFSYVNHSSVKSLLAGRVVVTVVLAVGAALLWLAMGITIGVISAIRQRSVWDRLALGFAIFFISAPVFWLGLVVLYLFADDIGKIPILPGAGSYTPITDNPWHWFTSLILPWLVLAAAFAAIYARLVRGNLIETMSEDYIRTARAKGLSERKVILRHGLRSAITPVVSALGLDLGLLLAGNAILTETVFNIPGIGRMSYNAIVNSDLPTIEGVVLFGALFIVVLNLLVDIAYAFIDPRVRYT